MDNFLFFPRVLAAALSDVSCSADAGLVIVSLWLQSDKEENLRARLQQNLMLGTIAMLLAFVAQMWLSTATMVGSSSFSVVRSQFADVMTGTHAGRALLFDLLFSTILLALLIFTRSGRSRIKFYSFLSVLTCLAIARAATGHPAADGDFTLPEYVQFIHLVSIAVWSGCVIAAGFVVVPGMLRNERDEAVLAFTGKLSQTATIALLLIMLSGVYNSYRGLGGSVAPLIATQWGSWLDVKIVLVCIAVSMGAFNRRILRRNSSLSMPQVCRLALVLRAEASVMLLILIVSALLANSPPANSP